ncbi:MAG TPA: glycoside hydrolase domain-containing protein [Nocardioidaceae bacterium]|nr:glycoside hydrolase domain-containing protein [Nocardioidaceae bacterium]
MKFPAIRRATTRAAVLLTTLLTATAGLSVAAVPAEAANRVTPGGFSGYGFDQCETQSQEVMDKWLTSSPYWAVGVYIAGTNRHCGDARQGNLTATWIATQLRNGWKVLPITVGPQASCFVSSSKKVRIVSDPADDYVQARKQGRLEAQDTVSRARALGITAGSTLWYDLEAYDIGNKRCRESALYFLSSWTRTLHGLGYVSGVYSSASSGIRAIDNARVLEPGRYVMPDRIWTAEWVSETGYRTPPTLTAPSLFSSYFSDDGWPGRRMRQYRGGHNETHGGATINIDTNYLHLGGGTRAGRAPRFCRNTTVDFPSYRFLRAGSRGAQVKAVQCLMKQKKLYGGRLSAVYNRGTERAVRRFQERRGVRVTGKMFRSTWTMLLSGGRTPVVKVGSGGNNVRRVQRALNAAVAAGVSVDGIFGPSTTAAVRKYQAGVGLRRTGVVASDTWEKLQTGKL